MITKVHSFGIATMLALCCSLPLSAQGYSDASIKKVGDTKDSSRSTANLTVRSSSNTRNKDVSFIFVGQSDSKTLDNRRPSGITRLTRKGHEASFSDVNMQTYYYIHDRSGSKSFDFGSHKNGLVYLITLRNVDLYALRNLNSDRLWTNANTNRKYGGDAWRSGCGRGKYRGLAYVNKRLRSYNKGVQIAAVMYDDYPTNVRIYRSRTSNTKAMNTLESFRNTGSTGGYGDDAMAVGMKTTDGGSTDELHFRASNCVGGNGENVLVSFTLKPSSGGGGTPPPVDNTWLIDDCDSASGWSSSNTKSISSNYKEGSGSLKSVGSGTDDFKKNFSAINGSGATALEFWYYVDKPERFEGSDQVELGSDGRPDRREYNWDISRSILESGWNYIKLPFSDARITGGTPDKTRLNWFRLYRKKSGRTVSRIDHIRLTGGGTNLKTQSLVSLDSNLENEYKLYPNPSHGEINLLIPMDSSNGDATISITNMMGQSVYKKDFTGLVEGNNEIVIDTQLSNAIYFVNVRTSESSRVFKLSINK